MKLSLEAIGIIDAIVQTGSFAKAAERVHKVRSALTYTVKKLEEDLGVQLFDRRGHKAKLTPAGSVLLKQGRILLQQSAYLETHIKAVESGWEETLSISYNDLIPFENLIGFIAAFQQACPQTQLRLNAERLNGTVESIAGEMRQTELHAVAMSKSSLCIGVSGELPNNIGLASMALPPLPFIFVVSPKHPLANLPEPLSNHDISAYPVVTATDTATSMLSRQVGILPGQSELIVTSIEAKKKAQIAGLGVGFLPAPFIKHELATGKLVAKEVERSKPILSWSIAWRTQNMGKALSWVVRTLKKSTFDFVT